MVAMSAKERVPSITLSYLHIPKETGLQSQSSPLGSSTQLTGRFDSGRVGSKLS